MYSPGDDIMDSDLEADDIDDADDNIIQESDDEEQEDMDHWLKMF